MSDTRTARGSNEDPPREITSDSGAAAEDIALFLDRYMLLHKVGEGSVGAVHATYDPELDRKVALKVLRPDRARRSSEYARTRFLREAQALARLAHPNVVTVHDVGEAGD